MALLSFNEAKSALLNAARPLNGAETLDTANAFGRVLAEDICSKINVPGFDNAAMDGYALRIADLAKNPAGLPVSQRIAAGDAPQPLAAASAARIFTGAPMPEGADTVVMQEDCIEESGMLRVEKMPQAGQHVRRAAGDIAAGQVLLGRGTRLCSAALGLIASVGIGEVSVFRRPRIAIFFTGSELRQPGEPLCGGQIYNSNRFVMRGFLQSCDVDILDLGIIPDTLAATRKAIRKAAKADLVLTSGGMSEGEEDHVKAAVEAEGRIDVWKIAAKPGKPLAFGEIRKPDGATPFIGLPGNPVAVWVGLHTLVRPFVRRMQGEVDADTVFEKRTADFHYTVKGNRLEFVRVRHNAAGALDIFRTQDSSVLSSAVWADGLAALPAGSSVSPGDKVDYFAIHG